jgi:hypothetical protein
MKTDEFAEYIDWRLRDRDGVIGGDAAESGYEVSGSMTVYTPVAIFGAEADSGGAGYD